MATLASCANAVINEGVQKVGFAASQWVLGNFPRSPGDNFCKDECHVMWEKEEKEQP